MEKSFTTLQKISQAFDFDHISIILTCTKATEVVHNIFIMFPQCEIENTTQEHMKQFQTVFLNSLAEHFMAVDILSGQNLPLPTSGSYAHIPNNIYYFFSRVVDKVWQVRFAYQRELCAL